MKRSRIREHIFALMFMSEFNPPDEMPEVLKLYLESEETGGDKAAEEEIKEKYERIVPYFSRLDEVIDRYSKKWPVLRIGKVELTILRLAVYEILLDDAVPEKVAVNEAVELAKKYGQDNGGSFVNGVLSGVLKDKDACLTFLRDKGEWPKEEES